MTSRFATPPEQIHLEQSKYGFHLPESIAKSWKTLEQSCHQAASILRSTFERYHPKVSLTCIIPTKPSKFSYFIVHSSKEIARSAISQSLDAFMVLFAYLSFCIAICKAPNDPDSGSLLTTSSKPRWFQDLSVQKNGLHPKWLQLLLDSPIADFTFITGPQRLGVIVNVARCSWLHLIPYMLKANIPIWLYWGVPPAFGQPLDHGALIFAPRTHPQSHASASSGTVVSQPVGPRVPSAHAGPGQLPGETWKEFMVRQNLWRKMRIQKEDDSQRRIRESREITATKQSCLGKKGPSVYVWEEDGGVWTWTLLTHGQVEDYWGGYRSSQRIFNFIDNCWDLCDKFDEGTAGQIEDDPNDSEDNICSQPQSQQAPTPFSSEIGRSEDASNFHSMLVDPCDVQAPTSVSVSSPAQVVALPRDIPHPDPQDTSDCASMLVDPPRDTEAPAPESVSSTPAQVAALPHDLPHPNP